MQRKYRNLLISGITFLGGLYFFLEYLLPEATGIGAYHDQISLGIQAVGAMAIGLGIINVLKVHGGRIMRTVPGWQNSLALVIGMMIALVVEGIDFSNSLTTNEERNKIDSINLFVNKTRENTSLVSDQLARITIARTKLDVLTQQIADKPPSAELDSNGELRRTLFDPLVSKLTAALDSMTAITRLYQETGTVVTIDEAQAVKHYQLLSTSLVEAAALLQQLATARHDQTVAWRAKRLIMEGFVESLGSAMFALLAFYIANAAYRAFRVRSIEALVMMIAALVVMLGQIPFGPLYIDERLPLWRLWLLEHLSTPAFRAIYFGMAIAGLSMAVRMWLSLESSPLSADNVQQKEANKS